MILRLLVPFAAALALVPAALAAYPAPYAAQGADAALPSLDGSLRFLTFAAGTDTQVVARRASGGATVLTRTVTGAFGVPMLTQSGLAGGMFHDGSSFVLQSVGFADTTHFAIVATQDLSLRDTIDLKGTFGFDALSPDGATLYLIQHTTTQDLAHYIVRAYDLRTHTLVPGRIADKTQKSWVMQGWAVSRATTPDGHWAYTLYANPGGYPFIHALDTVRGVAHCIGLPWTATSQDPVFNFHLVLKPGAVAVERPDGSTWRRIKR